MHNVAFGSAASNLVPGDTNASADVFVRDRRVGVTERVSVADGEVQANDVSFGGELGISADGRYVAFASRASNLVAGDAHWTEDVFVRDRRARTTERVSVNAGGAPPDGQSDRPAISADGRYVAFQSAASNLVAGDWNGEDDVFVRDRHSGATERVSVGGRVSYYAAISADGRHVAFISGTPNPMARYTEWTMDVFVRGVAPLAPCSGTDYAGAVRCALPRSYWRLDERVGGVAADDAGGAPAAYHGGRLGEPGPVAGAALGLNLHARAEREHVDAGDVHDFAGLRPFTLEAWVKPRDVGAHTARVVSKEHDGAGYLLGLDARGVAFSRYARGSAQTVRAPLRPGRWTHVVATYDGRRMRLFLDGREAAAGPSAMVGLPDHGGHFVLGAKSGRWRYFAGWVDEVAVYPVALDPATVARHFARATSPNAAAP